MKTIDHNEQLVYYSKREERVNRYTHGAGALASVIGALALITLASRQHDIYRLVSACIYGVAMVTFYCLSTAYHSVLKPEVRYLFRILDHASIYLMIAGFGLIGARLVAAVALHAADHCARMRRRDVGMTSGARPVERRHRPRGRIARAQQ